MNIDRIRYIYERIVNNGLAEEVAEDDLRRIRTVNSVSIVLLVTLLVYVLADLIAFEKPYAAGVEFLAFLTGVYYLIIQRRLNNVNVITHFATAIISASLFGISLLNGVGTSTSFWFALIPPFAFFVGGVKAGFIWSGITFIWLVVYTTLGLAGIYGGEISTEFATDIILAYVIITLLAFLFEHSRGHAVKALTKTNEEMHRLIYVVSHDLRTPLTALRGYSEFLREDIETSNHKEIQEDIERIDLMATNMGKMIDDLLNLSRVGRKTDNNEMVDTREIADLVVIENEPQLHTKNIRVEIVEPLPRAYMNRRKFEEVVRNLVSNAIKYMGESKDPLIKIGCHDTGKEYHFYVEDHGIGIEKKYFDKLFQLFVRHETMGQGSGIGLSIVKGFVEDLGGKVWIDSELGKGSIFWFSVPKLTPPHSETTTGA